MAFNFKDLKRKRLKDEPEGKKRLRGKNEEDDEFLNPYAKAKAEAHDEETDTVPVGDEDTEIEGIVEGEPEHTAEERLGESDGEYEDDTDLFIEEEEADEAHPDPAKKKARRKKYRRGPAKERAEPGFAFRRFL